MFGAGGGEPEIIVTGSDGREHKFAPGTPVDEISMKMRKLYPPPVGGVDALKHIWSQAGKEDYDPATALMSPSLYTASRFARGKPAIPPHSLMFNKPKDDDRLGGAIEGAYGMAEAGSTPQGAATGVAASVLASLGMPGLLAASIPFMAKGAVDLWNAPKEATTRERWKKGTEGASMLLSPLAPAVTGRNLRQAGGVRGVLRDIGETGKAFKRSGERAIDQFMGMFRRSEPGAPPPAPMAAHASGQESLPFLPGSRRAGVPPVPPSPMPPKVEIAPAGRAQPSLEVPTGNAPPAAVGQSSPVGSSIPLPSPEQRAVMLEGLKAAIADAKAKGLPTEPYESALARIYPGESAAMQSPPTPGAPPAGYTPDPATAARIAQNQANWRGGPVPPPPQDPTAALRAATTHPEAPPWPEPLETGPTPVGSLGLTGKVGDTNLGIPSVPDINVAPPGGRGSLAFEGSVPATAGSIPPGAKLTVPDVPQKPPVTPPGQKQIPGNKGWMTRKKTRTEFEDIIEAIRSLGGISESSVYETVWDPGKVKKNGKIGPPRKRRVVRGEWEKIDPKTRSRIVTKGGGGYAADELLASLEDMGFFFDGDANKIIASLEPGFDQIKKGSRFAEEPPANYYEEQAAADAANPVPFDDFVSPPPEPPPGVSTGRPSDAFPDPARVAAEKFRSSRIQREPGEEGFIRIGDGTRRTAKELWKDAIVAIRAEDNLGYDRPEEALGAILNDGPESLGQYEWSDPGNRSVVSAWAWAKGAQGKPRTPFEVLGEIYRIARERSEKNVTPETKGLTTGEEGFAKMDFDPDNPMMRLFQEMGALVGQGRDARAAEVRQTVLNAPEGSVSKRALLGLDKKKKVGKLADTPLFTEPTMFPKEPEAAPAPKKRQGGLFGDDEAGFIDSRIPKTKGSMREILSNFDKMRETIRALSAHHPQAAEQGLAELRKLNEELAQIKKQSGAAR